jgi:hypothetical protein
MKYFYIAFTEMAYFHIFSFYQYLFWPVSLKIMLARYVSFFPINIWA